MAKIELKKPIVEEIAGIVEGAQAVVLVNYSGLNVEQDTELRKTLREAGVTYKVYKNTMMKLAFKGTEFEALADDLNGTKAIAVSKDDATAPARILAEFAKKNDKLELISGVVEGKYADKAAILALASIPSREVLLGRLLGSMQGTIASFARVIKAIADQNGDAAAAE
jgi:large subunit ribosomal protein L10